MNSQSASDSFTTPTTARTAARGALWATADNWSQQGFGIITFVIVGNIVGPQVYGLMALGLLYILLGGSFIRDTFGEAIIQRADLEADHLDAAFWTLMAMAVLLTGLTMVLSVPIAGFLGDVSAAPVLVMLALTFPMMVVSNVLRSIARRRMNFRALAIRSFLAYGSGFLLAVGLALNGAGLWSLIGYQLCVHLIDAVALLAQVRWWPRLRFSRRHFNDIYPYSVKLIGNNFVANVAGQVDRVLIAKFIGVAPLGLYGMGKRIVDGIDQTVLGVIGSVGLPAFARVQKDNAALNAALMQATHFSSLVIAPAYIGLALVGQQLVNVVLSPEWHDTGRVVALFCVSGITFPAALFLSTVQRAVGAAGTLMALAATSTTLRIVLCLGAILAGYGIMGVLLGTVLAGFLMLPVRIYTVQRRTGFNVLEFLGSMGTAFSATALMALCVLACQWLVAPVLPPVAVLAVMIVTGIATYVGALALFARDSLHTIAHSLLPRRFLP